MTLTPIRSALLAASLLLATSISYSQEAKIMILERSDTAKLKSAYQEFQKARDSWEQAKLDVAQKYTNIPCDTRSTKTSLKCGAGQSMDGWEKVEFSVDFRAVVPARQPNFSLSSGLWNKSGYSALPAVGSLSFTSDAATSFLSSPSQNNSIMMTGNDGTVVHLDPSDGELKVHAAPGIRADLTTIEKRE